MSETRPSKKQRELLSFIDGFITGHGYGPSYREIMRSLNYKSVSTVATHVDNLISKGHLRKRDNSARSLEVTGRIEADPLTPRATKAQEKWLIDHIKQKFTAHETKPTQKTNDELFVLVGALQVLGFEDAARAFKARLIPTKKPSRATITADEHA